MNTPLANHSTGFKLLVFSGIVMISLSVFSFIALVLIYPLFGINLLDNPHILSELDHPEIIGVLKFMQLINAISLFFVPPFLFAFLVTKNKISYFKLSARRPFIFYIVVPILIWAAIPLINLMAEWNSYINFPDFLSDVEEWMKNSEESAKKITEAFLNVTTIGGLLFNILLIAIIPAIGEELLFRGVLQRLFTEGTKNKHAGIWLAAILFSAIHMQFYGFLPRMMIGVMLGYLLLWTGSLWIPILAHFINNATAVILAYLVHKNAVSNEIETVGSGTDDSFYILTSAVMVGLLIYFYYSNRAREKDIL